MRSHEMPLGREGGQAVQIADDGRVRPCMALAILVSFDGNATQVIRSMAR